MFAIRVVVFMLVIIASMTYVKWADDVIVEQQLKTQVHQLDNPSGDSSIQHDKQMIDLTRWAVPSCVIVLGFVLFFDSIKSFFNLCVKSCRFTPVLFILFGSGCYKPFEPVKLEIISNTEEAFLLPLKAGANPLDQSSTNSEEYLKANLVYTQQVKIPQQWVPLDYETVFWRGEWRDAALLIRVDTSPVTREWTADENSGTSNKNEAIWVMTADQVEFSTGWTCTARIANRDAAVKFLHNYPAGSLKMAMDTEIRAKIQTTFGLEVTDQKMEKLRTAATPHLKKVVDEVTEFFEGRGITITNLGISGGFVYKDKTIMDKLVEVFNADQKVAIARAETAAQEEVNKKVRLEADGKAQAIKLEKETEAEMIKLVADAKAYELEKAKLDVELYTFLKRLELEKDKLKTWDGHFPSYYMGGNGNSSPDFLLQVPVPTITRPENKK